MLIIRMNTLLNTRASTVIQQAWQNFNAAVGIRISNDDSSAAAATTSTTLRPKRLLLLHFQRLPHHQGKHCMRITIDFYPTIDRYNLPQHNHGCNGRQLYHP
jgi:hypothetical protein